MESSEKIKRYKKMRATQQWLIKTCIHCMIIWSLLNMIILLVNKYGQIFHIPKSREYLCYTLLIVLFVLIRFPVLLSRFEAIESGKIGKQTDNGERNKKSGARATDTIKLPKLVTNPELALLIKEYKRKKVRTISMYCCVGIAFVVGFTSLFFTLFVYDFSPFKENPVPKLDQFLIPIMMACVTIFYIIKVITFTTSKIDKDFIKQVDGLKAKTPELVAANLQESKLGFPMEIMDSSNRLVVSMAAFVRHCVENGLYDPNWNIGVSSEPLFTMLPNSSDLYSVNMIVFNNELIDWNILNNGTDSFIYFVYNYLNSSSDVEQSYYFEIIKSAINRVDFDSTKRYKSSQKKVCYEVMSINQSLKEIYKNNPSITSVLNFVSQKVKAKNK